MGRVAAVVAVVAGWSIGIGTPACGQVAAAGEDAEKTILAWLGLVSGGGADRAWSEASLRFQYRISQRAWREWVEGNPTRLTGLAARRALEFTLGKDELPLEPLEWVRIVYARDRAQGGRVVERVIALQEGGEWRVAEYQTWPDDRAAVSSAYLPAVPYHSSYAGQWLPHGYWRGGRLLRPVRPAPPAPAPERPSAQANPATFPKRPPPGA